MFSMKYFILVLATFLGVQASYALPVLQLDVAAGYYDSGTETIVANNNPFTLYALFSDQGKTPTGTFYIAAAITPKTDNPPVADFGSFSVNGTTYSAGNMLFGTPPVDSILDSQDLPSHGIYDTHYAEIAFTFNLSDNATPYNAQDAPGGLQEPSVGSLYYHAFAIDLAGIAAGYNVHFDLYNTKIDSKTGTVVVNKFAPFSHDAEGGNRVPDHASSVGLLGMAMVAVAGFRRRFSR
jgi:hypothetical protein